MNSGEVYFPIEQFVLGVDPATLVGWSFTYDAATGGFRAMRPVFSKTLSRDTGVGTSGIHFRTVYSSSQETQTRSLDLDVGGSIGAVELASSLSQSSQSQTGTLSTTFQMGAYHRFPRAMVDLLALTAADYQPEAWGILALPQAQRATAWRNAGFGEYIALGFGLYRSVNIDFSMQQASSYSSRSSFFDLDATYGSFSAGVSIGEALSQAMSTGSVNYQCSAEGIACPGLPSLDQISTISGQWDWFNVFSSYGTVNDKMNKGLHLMPVTALGVLVEVPEWDEDKIVDAGIAANNALFALRSSSRWNQPATLSLFLAQHPIPGSPNAHSALTVKRSELSTVLMDLRAALRNYLDADNSQLPAVAPALSAATIAVNSKAMELSTILQHISEITAALPRPTVSLYENYDLESQCSPNQPRRFSAVIDNVGMFVLPNNHEAELAWLTRAPANSDATFRLIEDRACLDMPSITHNLQNWWSSPDIISVETYQSGAAAGLSRISFQFTVHVSPNSREFQGLVVDDFGRTSTPGYVDIQDHNWPPVW